MSRPRCVVVDGYSSGVLVAMELIARGFEPIHVQSRPQQPQNLQDSFRKSDFAQNIVHLRDFEATLRKVKEFAPKAIIIGSEPGIELTDRLAQSLGLPGNNPKTSALRRNKFLMQEALRKNQLNSILQTKASELGAVVEWVQHNGFPAVLKPLNSAGTDSVYICQNIADVKAAFGKILGKVNKLDLKNEEVLVQECLEGQEYIIDSVSMDGRHCITDICRYKKVTANKRTGIYESVHLMEYQGKIPKILISYFEKVLDVLGIENGPAHGEIIVTERGPVLVEVGARYAGGEWPGIVDLCTGFGQVRATVERFLSPDLFVNRVDPYELSKQSRLVFMISDREGKIEEIPEISQKNFPSLQWIHWKYRKGDTLIKTTDALTVPAMIALVHEDPATIDKDHQKIRRMEQEGLYECLLGRKEKLRK